MGQPMRSGSKDEDKVAAQILVLKTTYAPAMTTQITEYPERLMRFVMAIVDLLKNLGYLQPLLVAASMASKTLTVFSKTRNSGKTVLSWKQRTGSLSPNDVSDNWTDVY